VIGVDGGGREIVRVDRSGHDGEIRIVPDAELGARDDRNYFKETIKLRSGETYVSRLNLDQADRKIIEPHRPTLRVATPLFAPDGKLFGILIINVDMRPAFERVRASARPGEGVYLINERGDYLLHPDAAREFGSELGMPIESWQSDFPVLASSIGTTQSVAQVVPDQDGRPSGITLAPAILAGNEWIAVVKTAPSAVVTASADAIQGNSLLAGLVAVLCAAALAVWIARSLTRPIVQLTAAVEGAGRDGSATIPVDASGETGVLARAFARAIGETSAKTVALEHEIEEHRRTEAARGRLADRERLFSAAVESSHDAIITKSLEGTITGWNPAAERMFGYTAAEAVGQNIDLIVPPERLSEVHNILSRIEQGHAIEQHETVRLHKSGSAVAVSLSISPIKTPSVAIVGA
jgi:PAS domain S-box-containing protein